MPDSFVEIYHRTIKANHYQDDPCQAELAQQLDPVFRHSAPLTTSLQAPSPKAITQGIYIWGPVGRGKTFIMDLLFKHMPEKTTLRLHFHRFMANIHEQMRELQGRKDPLKLIATKLSKQYQLICFDEFYLNDVADAMILSRLLSELFKNGTLLITTSNRPPEQLCKDPLFEDRVKPIIATIHQQMSVFNLAGGTDHRLRQLTQAPSVFHTGETKQLQRIFNSCSPHNKEPANAEMISILGRDIPVRGFNTHCAWFDFEHICMGPRSQLDYIDLANRFNNIIVSNVPQLGGHTQEQIKARGTEDGSRAVKAGERQVLLGKMDDPARRFISLVDELYDRGVNLFLSVEVPLEQIYTEGSLTFEFARTYSRLTEMQSEQYQFAN
ncbi:cell division protein ZapE [Amphritea balenae]|uniref:AFG1 family ATPase n=1 Tax=Amphritea balenae TaxID=452629 RepID=A0A3P1SJN5_9GAMM|nr:cell division protein ZapE [Amphritea balenae]RRC97501.1 AFG1 family ATPase [Amphritea balenae]GGK74572.1 cell division protein ZapE [Amphritea balenae]